MWSVNQCMVFSCLLQNSLKSSGLLKENEFQQKFFPAWQSENSKEPGRDRFIQGDRALNHPLLQASESLDVDMQDFKQAFQTLSNHHVNIILI